MTAAKTEGEGNGSALERAHRDIYERIAVERPDGTRRPLSEVVDPDAESRAALAGKGVQGRAAGFSFERWRKVLNAERAGLGLTPVPRDWIEPALEAQSAAGFDEAKPAKPSRKVAVALGRLDVDPVKAAVEAASDGALTLTEGSFVKSEEYTFEPVNLTGFSDAPRLSGVRLPESTTEPKDNS